MNTYPITIHLPESLLRDLLVDAADAIGYWASITDAKQDSTGVTSIHLLEDEISIGAKLLSRDVTLEDMRVGIERLGACAMRGKFEDHRPFTAASEHFGHAISGTGDRTTADVVLQLAVFNDLVYS